MESGIIIERSRTREPYVVEISVGLMLRVRDFVLKEMQENEYIKENFKLNIRRYNRWWYGVYFDKKED